MINPIRTPPHILDAVHSPGPSHMTCGVVFFRPFLFQKGLGFAIASLLAQIGANRVAAMMPDHCGRTETEGPAVLLQAPADIHIVAGDAELRVESADRLETRSAE